MYLRSNFSFMLQKTLFYCAFFTLLLCNGNYLFGNEETFLRKSIQNEKNKEKKFQLSLKLGEYYQQNNIPLADSMRKYILSSALNLNEKAIHQSWKYDLEMEQILGNKSKYKAIILKIQPYVNTIDNTVLRIKTQHLLANMLLEIRSVDEAEEMILRTVDLLKQLRNYELNAANFRLKAMVALARNNKELALKNVELAIQYSKRSTNKSLMADCVSSQAEIYRFFGQVELSISKNFLALQLAREVKHNARTATILRQVGEVQLDIYNFIDAKKYFEESKLIAQSIHDSRLEGLALVEMGRLFLMSNQLKEAKNQLDIALKLLRPFSDDDGLGKVKSVLGQVFFNSSNYDIALRNFNEALVHFEESGNRFEIAQTYYLVGRVFEKQKKYENALNYLNRAVNIFGALNFQTGMNLSYRELSKVYKLKGNLPKAFEYLEKYAIFSDSSKTIQVSSKIAEISELFKAEQRERLISLQADKIEIQKRERDLTTAKLENTELKNLFQTYVIIGFILLLIFGIFFFYNRWKQRNILQLQRETEMNQVLLRSQMNPHFIFNAMSVIQSYIYDNDTKNSSKFLVNFSKLMRLILENSSKEFISLHIENDILCKYLETQKMRFGDRFEYEVNIEEDLFDEGVVIPPMITQPFIENALEHGQLHTLLNGFINVHINKSEGLLHVKIEDNGIGRKGSEQNKKSSEHKSMAMKITQDRIDILSKKFGISGRLEIEDFDKENETGTLVNIYLPYKFEQETN